MVFRSEKIYLDMTSYWYRYWWSYNNW